MKTILSYETLEQRELKTALTENLEMAVEPPEANQETYDSSDLVFAWGEGCFECDPLPQQ